MELNLASALVNDGIVRQKLIELKLGQNINKFRISVSIDKPKIGRADISEYHAIGLRADLETFVDNQWEHKPGPLWL